MSVNAADWPLVIVESPFAGDIDANLAYARRACLTCLARGEVPYASHLFFPQMLDDNVLGEREIGMTAGYAMWKAATKIVFFADRGYSRGMLRARERAMALNFNIEEMWIGT